MYYSVEKFSQIDKVLLGILAMNSLCLFIMSNKQGDIKDNINVEMKIIRPQYHFRESPQGLLAWDVNRLIRLSDMSKVNLVALTDIKEIDEPYWYCLNGGSPTCRSIIEHTKLIHDANLQYPIILCSGGKIMDGMHRVCKALLLGQTSILAVQFENYITPDFIDILPDDLPYEE